MSIQDTSDAQFTYKCGNRPLPPKPPQQILPKFGLNLFWVMVVLLPNYGLGLLSGSRPPITAYEWPYNNNRWSISYSTAASGWNDNASLICGLENLIPTVMWWWPTAKGRVRVNVVNCRLG